MKLTTKKGYGFFEATSALQKAIRRSDEQTAIYFAVEFWNSGYDEYVWKRLKIITSEDVGLASPNMPAIINSLYTFYAELKKKSDADSKSKGESNRPERMYYIHAVLALTRAKKSRLVDYTLVSAWREHDDIYMDIPDYAYDMHNTKGKSMGRDVNHFYDEGTLIENYVPQPGETGAREKAKKLHNESPNKIKFSEEKKGSLNQKSTLFDE